MKAGDLVRIVNEWVVHNPWMKGTVIEEETAQVGLIVTAPEVGNLVVKVLIGGEVKGYSKKVLEVING